MEALIPLAGCAIVVAVMIAAIVRSRSNLEQAARHFGGRVEKGGFWSEPRLEVSCDGVPATLIYFSGFNSSFRCTRIQFQWKAPGVLRLVPKGFWTSLRKAFGAEDIQVGDGGFDWRFLVQGSPEKWVREALDPAVRARLRAIYELGSGFLAPGGARLEAGPTGLMISCNRMLVGDRDRLIAFIDAAFAVLRRLRANAPETGIVLAAVEIVRQGRCPVCAHTIEERPRRCARCATPHHADCWDFFGGCSIYACGSARAQ